MPRHLLLIPILLAALAVPTSASAHAALVAESPVADSVLERPPTAIDLTFTEPVNAIGARVQIIAANGKHYERGAPTVRDRTLSAGLDPALPAGTTTVAWSAISDDGHRVSGAFTFAVGAATTAAPSATRAATRPRGAAMSSTVLRAARFAAILLLLGLVALLLLVWQPTVRRGSELAPAVADAADAAFRHVARRLALLVPLALAAICAVYLPVEARADGISVAELLRLQQGRIDVLALAIALAILPWLWWAARSDARWPLIAAGLLALGLAVTPGLAGHAGVQDPAWLALLVDGVHVAAAGSWAGGVLVLALAAPAVFRATSPETRGPLIHGVVRRFTRVALAGLGALVITGTVATISLTSSLTDLWQTPWGTILLAKLAVVLLAVVAARFVRRAIASFERSVQVEAILIVTVIALTGVLTGLAPQLSPASPAGGPLHLERRIDARTAQLDIAPGQAGAPSEVHLIVVNDVGQPAVDVADASVELRSEQAGITLPVTLTRIAAAHWAGTITIPEPGAWTVVARLRIGEFRDESITTTMTALP